MATEKRQFSSQHRVKDRPLKEMSIEELVEFIEETELTIAVRVEELKGARRLLRNKRGAVESAKRRHQRAQERDEAIRLMLIEVAKSSETNPIAYVSAQFGVSASTVRRAGRRHKPIA